LSSPLWTSGIPTGEPFCAITTYRQLPGKAVNTVNTNHGSRFRIFGAEGGSQTKWSQKNHAIRTEDGPPKIASENPGSLQPWRPTHTWRRVATIGGKVRNSLYSESNGKQKLKTSCKSRTEITQAIRSEAC